MPSPWPINIADCIQLCCALGFSKYGGRLHIQSGALIGNWGPERICTTTMTDKGLGVQSFQGSTGPFCSSWKSRLSLCFASIDGSSLCLHSASPPFMSSGQRIIYFE